MLPELFMFCKKLGCMFIQAACKKFKQSRLGVAIKLSEVKVYHGGKRFHKFETSRQKSSWRNFSTALENLNQRLQHELPDKQTLCTYKNRNAFNRLAYTVKQRDVPADGNRPAVKEYKCEHISC